MLRGMLVTVSEAHSSSFDLIHRPRYSIRDCDGLLLDRQPRPASCHGCTPCLDQVAAAGMVR